MEEQLLGLLNQQSTGELRAETSGHISSRFPLSATLTPGTDLGPLCILGSPLSHAKMPPGN